MKICFMRSLIIPCFLLATVGCRKEAVSPVEENDIAVLLKTSSPGGCRITSYDNYNGKDDYHAIDFYKYEDGKVAEVQSYLRFTMEYNKQGRLIRSRAFDGDRPSYIIDFGYLNNKIVYETWRYAYNNALYDQVILTYNKKGDLSRNESLAQQYHTAYEYYPDGSLASWTFYYRGVALQKGEYSYDDNYKNPLSTLTGLDHMFMYANSGFGVSMGKKWFSGEKISYWDGSNWFIYYQLSSSKHQWDAGSQHYPVKVNYADNESGLNFENSFSYENCNGHSEEFSARDQTLTLKNNNLAEGSKENIPPKKFIY